MWHQDGGRIRQARLELPYIQRELSLSYHLTTPTYLRSHSFHAIALPRQIAMDAKKENISYYISIKYTTGYYRDTLLAKNTKKRIT